MLPVISFCPGWKCCEIYPGSANFGWIAIKGFEHELEITTFFKTLGIIIVSGPVNVTAVYYSIIIDRGWSHHIPVTHWNDLCQINTYVRSIKTTIKCIHWKINWLVKAYIPWCRICIKDEITDLEPSVAVICCTFLCGHLDPDMIKSWF